MSVQSYGPRINFNAPAMTNVNRLDLLEGKMKRSMERISSGERLTRAADGVDAFGISEQLRGKIRSLHTASRNVQDGIALINVAEGALAEVDDILHRMRELTVQAANGTLTDEDRKYISLEIDKLREEINYTSENTQYNGHKLLSGKSIWNNDKGGYIQMNTENKEHIDNIPRKIDTVNTATLFLDDLSVDTQLEAGAAIDLVKNAVDIISDVRSKLGATANRLEEAWRHTEKIVEDNTAYESKLRDTDVAAEMVEQAKNQIIHQYCNSMLAQANQTPQSIFRLLSK